MTLHTQATGGAGVTRFAARDGQRLSYESSGSIDAVPVIALHDLLGDRGRLASLRERLLVAGFRVTLPDARGHGASPTISGRVFPPSELAGDTVAVLDAEGLGAAHVVAIGWSAATALSLAVMRPQRVSSLVLVEPYLPALMLDHPESAARETGAAHVSALREAAVAASKGLTDRALDLALDARLGVGWRDRLSRARLSAIRRAAVNLGPLLAGIESAVPDPDALRRISVATTLLARDDAPAVEHWTTATLARLLPAARVATIPDGEAGADALSPAMTDAMAWALADGGEE